MVLFGEIGLAGEVRQVAQPNLRLKESSKLGFAEAVVPKAKIDKQKPSTPKGMQTHEAAHVTDLAELFAGRVPSSSYPQEIAG
jgi:DNA repair protein RadA/Sms